TLDPEDSAELVATIRAEADRLDRLVGNLLDLSRLRSGAAEPHPELWPIDDLVARSLEQLGDRGHPVDVTFDDDAPPVRADAVQIERVLVNRRDNALKFSPPGSRVRLGVEPFAAEVLIHVVDEGPGSGDLERIFEPFHTGGAQGGAGLGLAIARGF